MYKIRITESGRNTRSDIYGKATNTNVSSLDYAKFTHKIEDDIIEKK